MGDSADWSDDNVRIVCELFAEQVRAHNRSGTHLNRNIKVSPSFKTENLKMKSNWVSCLKISRKLVMIIELLQAVIYLKLTKHITEEDNDKEADRDEYDPSDAEDGTPTSGKATKRCHVAEKDKVKKPKSAGGHWMQEQIARIIELNEKTTTSCKSIVLARMEESAVCSIKVASKRYSTICIQVFVILSSTHLVYGR
ncbi:hypothetical protein BAE44_0019044 [Dichanthelium oligosanthes]|uniref:Uncharacterized protein n=1 Tax=Dichanthelium oligosanthes TaxID=888268 RepID=A0A1E5V4E2_9POAL|nr:hypothetical protein BAE44_0019044 [Dichanthelium oligosanthes]